LRLLRLRAEGRVKIGYARTSTVEQVASSSLAMRVEP
jgi:hypothetical protein